MSNYHYDEAATVAQLSPLPRRLLVLPALLAATRLLPAYVHFCNKTGRGDAESFFELHAALRREVAHGAALSESEVVQAANTVEAMVPSEADGWDEETQPYAEDAAAALAYAFRALAESSAQGAAWALRRAYEAADRFAQGRDDPPVGGAERERALLAHPVVQTELGRQERDLRDAAALAGSGSTVEQIDELLQRAVREAETLFPLASGARCTTR